MNSALRGVPTTPWAHASGSGDRPTTPEGRAALKEHNDLAHSLATTLGVISGQADITGQCDQCGDNGPAT
jgi:hypothetical protein